MFRDTVPALCLALVVLQVTIVAAQDVLPNIKLLPRSRVSESDESGDASEEPGEREREKGREHEPSQWEGVASQDEGFSNIPSDAFTLDDAFVPSAPSAKRDLTHDAWDPSRYAQKPNYDQRDLRPWGASKYLQDRFRSVGSVGSADRYDRRATYLACRRLARARSPPARHVLLALCADVLLPSPSPSAPSPPAPPACTCTCNVAQESPRGRPHGLDVDNEDYSDPLVDV